MKNPIIGITLDYENNGGYSKFPWYAIRENYLSCLHKFGAIPFPLFHQSSLNDYFLKTLDGLVITGGNFDINPALYLETADGSRNIKNKRTNFEIEIFKKFLKASRNIVLGDFRSKKLSDIIINKILKYSENKKNINVNVTNYCYCDLI